MKLKEAIAVADAVRVNGQLAGEIERWDDYAFTARWINGTSHTYSQGDIDCAKFYNGTFIIDNDVVEFFTLAPLPTVG